MKTLRTILAVAGFCLCALSIHAQSEGEPGWNNLSLEQDPEARPGQGFGGGEGEWLGYPDGQTTNDVAATITEDIAALARGLGHDPQRIYAYVRDHIRHVFYFGSKKGAQLTLLERSGNDFDQSALLVALLRAAGHSASYRFGFMDVPYERADHWDFRHWVGLSITNDWLSARGLLRTLMPTRGYPMYYAELDPPNFVTLQRVWVKLSLGGTNYFLDPAFKISEPASGTNLIAAMGLNTNDLLAVVGGTATADYVTNLNESALRGKLRDYTTNLLAWLQSNAPNASVEQIVGGARIVPSVVQGLSLTNPFPVYTNEVPVENWTAIPTNLMSRLTVTLGDTNQQFLLPALRGQRLSLTFDGNGLARLWLEDSVVLEKSTSGSARTTNVTLAVNHPFGSWDKTNNVLMDTGGADESLTRGYQRTNAAYALLYAFESSEPRLRGRQERLDAYRQQGLDETSPAIQTETLNVMGLSWLVQSELAHSSIAFQKDVLSQFHHRLGRLGQEAGNGYYIDVYLQLSALVAAGGTNATFRRRSLDTFDLANDFSSALEHGIIEQFQDTNLVAASTIKLLQLANTNGQKIFLATNGNWTTGVNIRNQLTNYSTGDLTTLDGFIANNYTLLLPQNGLIRLADTNSWGGYGIIARRETATSWSAQMLISGGYQGGHVSDRNAKPKPSGVAGSGSAQPGYYDPQSPFTPSGMGGDPVNMADGAFRLETTDLAVGQAEPRGLHFARHYSSSRRQANPAGLAYGWTHNYDLRAAEVSAPLASLGATTPAQMAPMLVALRAAAELYSGPPTPKSALLAALLSKWGVDQLIKNAVSVTLGADTVQFIRQPDGQFTPPAGSTMTLATNSTGYALQERHGNIFQFNAARRLTNILDQYNQTLSVTHNASNWVDRVSDWKGRYLQFNYSGTPQRLTSVSDGTRTVAYGYSTDFSSRGDLVSVTDPEQKTRSYSYDTNHHVVLVRNALSQVVTTNLYDHLGRVTEQASEGDTNKLWRFYWSGFANVEQDPAGSQRWFLHDDQSRLVGVRDALGQTNRMVYDGQDHVVMTISLLGETNRFEYDGRHNLVRHFDALGKGRTNYFDSLHRLTTAVDARGHSSRFGYNAKFQVTGITNGAGVWTTFTYDATTGLLSTRADAAGTTTFGYDTQGYLNGITHPNGLGSEGFLNSALGDMLSHTNARAQVTGYQYNGRRELTHLIAPGNVTNRVSYDAAANVQTRTDGRGFSVSNAWSATRKLLATTLPTTPAGTPTLGYAYDSRDWLLRATNALARVTQFGQNLAGRPTTVIDPLLRTNRFGHDADGRKIGATNAAAEATRWAYNARGETVALTNALHKALRYDYDANGNLLVITNRRGGAWRFVYDAANRLVTNSTPTNRIIWRTYNSRGLLETVHEPSQDTATLYYDARNRLTNRVDGAGSALYRYDPNNNLLSVTENSQTLSWGYDTRDRVSAFTNAEGFVLQYAHDQNGNLTNLVYPGSRAVRYAYDSHNRLTNVVDWANRQTSLEYDLAGQLKKITRPNGTVRETSYDAGGQATNIVEYKGNSIMALFKLRWDAAGRITNEFTAPLPHAWTPPTRTMTLDVDNRIATFGGQTVSHDVDGNMTSGPGTNATFLSYGYDARNRLRSVGGLSYGYDPGGNRTSVTNGGTVTRFVVNPNAALSQVLLRIQNGVTNYYVYGAGLLYEVTETATSTNTLTYHFDYRGSTVALTDAGGNVRDRVEYSPYGSLTYRWGTNDTPFLFNGRYGVQTDANGLLHMRARYYNPYLCRFVNSDPVGFAGGMNLYAFADGNPVNLLDPFGLGTEDAGGGSWLAQIGLTTFNNMFRQTTLFGSVLSQVQAAWGQYNKYGASGYAAQNGAWNATVMLLGEYAGTTPFAEGWHGTDIGYGVDLSTLQSAERLVSGGASMLGWVMMGAGLTSGSGSGQGVNTWWVGQDGYAAAQASGGTTLTVSGAGTFAEQSAAAARAATGPQNAFIGTGAGQTFWNVELPQLLQNMNNNRVPNITVHF
ncbi:MAG: RHS repeat protein [Verrucomicrobia bacterium]|nr:RHS repeat protein [Verrucomicrobiota bacterium]